MTTAGGADFDDFAGYLEAAVGASNPLPDNPEGLTALAAAMAAVAMDAMNGA